MRHPFALDPEELENLELDFEELLTDEEAAQVGGGYYDIQCISQPCPGSEGGDATTEALGEEGGYYPWPQPTPYPIDFPYPIKPPEITTFALGEEGGEPVLTKALYENGEYPYPIQVL